MVDIAPYFQVVILKGEVRKLREKVRKRRKQLPRTDVVVRERDRLRLLQVSFTEIKFKKKWS